MDWNFRKTIYLFSSVDIVSVSSQTANSIGTDCTGTSTGLNILVPEVEAEVQVSLEVCTSCTTQKVERRTYTINFSMSSNLQVWSPAKLIREYQGLHEKLLFEEPSEPP